MRNSKILLSVFMMLTIIFVSVAPTFAVVAPEDSVSSTLQWESKICEVLIEKMAEASDTDLIPVWVWMTDIDMNELEQDIESKTGLTHEKLITARSEITYNSLESNSDNTSLTAVDINEQSVSQENALTYLEATKTQREKIAEDTEIYLSAKKSLAQQRYITENTSKLKQLGISSNKIDFQSELTPSFIAYLTKGEIIETAKSSNVVELGYFSEYDEANTVEEPTQAEVLEVEEELTLDLAEELALEPTEAPTELPTLDVSTLHTGIKQAIQHDQALEKYEVTGEDVKVLHIDHDHVRSDFSNINLVPHPTNIYNLIEECTYPVTKYEEIPFDKQTNHANFCVSYLQAFAENVEIYSVPIPYAYYHYNQENNTNINPYEDVEYAITNVDVDLINASCDQGADLYNDSFSSKWHDAIISVYNIPIIASNGNGRSSHVYPIAPASGYNSIAVGIYNYRENQMFDDYTFNPTDSNSRVAYKPDLVVGMDEYGGTSAGAPVVTAIVAMMMELDPSLKGNPELVKAILMASCHEKALPGETDDVLDPEETMGEGLTVKQGAGKVNALRALNIVALKTYGYAVIPANSNGMNIAQFSLNSQVYGDSNETYPLNVSIAWLRKNTKGSNNLSENDISLGTKHEFNLRVSYTGQDPLEVKVSEKENSGKQLVFYENPDLDEIYRIRIYRGINDINDGKSAVCGYAYSVGNFEKVLERVEISGPTAVGETLTANAYNVDATLAVGSELIYQWYSSTDGDNWQIISGVTSSTYTLTSSDLNTYIKCIVIQDYLNDPEAVSIAQTKVIQYGDVDNDGEISVMDANMISQYAAEMITLTEEQLLAADVDGDGSVTSSDATLVQQYALGMIDCFPVENE